MLCTLHTWQEENEWPECNGSNILDVKKLTALWNINHITSEVFPVFRMNSMMATTTWVTLDVTTNCN